MTWVQLSNQTLITEDNQSVARYRMQELKNGRPHLASVAFTLAKAYLP